MDLIEQVKQYARQQLLDPLQDAGRWLAFGVLGSILIVIGSVSLTLAILRGLQTEAGSWVTGNLSWIPYLLTLGVVVIVAMLVALRISRKTL